uniref:Uncharacterized protein n=1 Tax=Spongospora subterranea TaxID=70186 RepID=A0A0H5QKQ4_9EUKA|eukprot:CRZ02720.1 hypothetical protein [Spongospora subterranea]
MLMMCPGERKTVILCGFSVRSANDDFLIVNTAAFENQNTTESVRSQVAMRFHLFRLKLLFLWLSSNVIPILITRSGTILTCLIPIELLFLVICQVGIAVLSVYYQIGHIFLYLILAVLVFLNGSRFIGSLVYLFGHNASPSMMVKMILAPIRPNVWLSLVKLPFSVIISSIGLIVVMFSFFCPISPLLSGLARLDIWFSHLGTSSSKYAVKTFIPTATLQRYFGTIRLMITLSAFIVIALITLMIVSMNRSLAPWNFCPSALPWCNPDINLPSKWTIISILILLGCNIGYGAEFATRRVLQKIACQS